VREVDEHSLTSLIFDFCRVGGQVSTALVTAPSAMRASATDAAQCRARVDRRGMARSRARASSADDE